MCERFVVAWTSPAEDVAYAAAFIAAGEDHSHRPVGCTWVAPESWPEPMTDLTRPRMQLEYRGGHGQDVSARPGGDTARSEWLRWLGRYELAATRVFLSYAKPDGATLALPVREALRATGTTVWFDREQDLNTAWLNAGLPTRSPAATISRNSASGMPCPTRPLAVAASGSR